MNYTRGYKTLYMEKEWQLLIERKPDDSRLVQIIYYTGRVDKARYREYVNEKNKDIWTDEDGCIIEKTSIHAWRDF